MKVLCVMPFLAPESIGKPKPEVGDEDMVINEREEFGDMYYYLQRFGTSICYHADHFATLPDQPAEVIEEETINLQPA